MTTEEFVKGFYEEKQNLLKTYLEEDSETEVCRLINSLNLTDTQNEIIQKVLASAFTDLLYGVLLGLDGASSIGNLSQQQFTVIDENNNVVCGKEKLGEVEAYAYKYFHEL